MNMQGVITLDDVEKVIMKDCVILITEYYKGLVFMYKRLFRPNQTNGRVNIKRANRKKVTK